MAKLRIAVPAEDMPAMKEALSLAGKTILITRQREQSEELTA